MGVSAEKRLVHSLSCRRSLIVTVHRTVSERTYERILLEGNSKGTGVANIFINVASTSIRWQGKPPTSPRSGTEYSNRRSVNAPLWADRCMKTLLTARGRPQLGLSYMQL